MYYTFGCFDFYDVDYETLDRLALRDLRERERKAQPPPFRYNCNPVRPVIPHRCRNSC